MNVKVYTNNLPFKVKVYTENPNAVSVVTPKPLRVSVSLVKDGTNGKSAYEIAVENGFVGSVADWLESLQFGGENKIYNEVALGVVDGANANFTTANNFVASTLQVFAGSAKLWVNEDFQITGSNSFHLFESPLIGETIFINYTKN